MLRYLDKTALVGCAALVWHSPLKSDILAFAAHTYWSKGQFPNEILSYNEHFMKVIDYSFNQLQDFPSNLFFKTIAGLARHEV